MRIKYFILPIIILAAFLRLFMLPSIPAGVTSDEADTGYDAYSILKTGRDQWGISYPIVSFKGFGDYRMGLYTYTVIPFVNIFDLSPLATRLPSAISGILSVVFIYFLVKKIFDEKVALIASLMLSISPWAIGMSRQGIESNMAMLFYILGIYLFLKFRDSKKYLFLSFLFFILSIYSYTSYLIITPITIFVVCFFERKNILKVKKELLWAFGLFFVCILPVILFSSAGNTRISQIGLTNDITSLGIIDVLNLKLGSCYSVLPDVFCKIFYNKPVTFFSVFISNYLHHFSLDFLYLEGTTTQFSILPQRGLLYSYEVIFLLFGLFFIFLKRKGLFVIVLLFFSPLADSLTGGGHHSRSLSMLPLLITIQAVGFVFFVDYSIKFKKRLGYILVTLTFMIILYSFISFVVTYFNYFKKYYSPYTLYAYQGMSKKLPDFAKRYQNVYISNYLNDEPQYIFYLFYNKYQPQDFMSRRDVIYSVDKNGFVRINKVGNINFSSFNFSNGVTGDFLDKKDSIFIASPDAFPKGVKSIASFKNLSGGSIFEAVEYRSIAIPTDE